MEWNLTARGHTHDASVRQTILRRVSNSRLNTAPGLL